jgi:hypothetical protein
MLNIMKYKVVRAMRIAGWLVGGIIVLAAAIPAVAQGGPPPGTGPPLDPNPMREERERQTSEARLRTAESGAAEDAEKQKLIRLAIANVKQDFTRIQVLRNDIARNLVARKPLDYNLITEQTAEIRKRAQRLNVYLSARAPENKEQESALELTSQEMIDALVKLCTLIDRYTENPALKNAATIDASQNENSKKERAKADLDLLDIIKLSDSIHKKSDSLRDPK